MCKLILIMAAALFLATGAAHAQDWQQRERDYRTYSDQLGRDLANDQKMLELERRQQQQEQRLRELERHRYDEFIHEPLNDLYRPWR